MSALLHRLGPRGRARLHCGRSLTLALERLPAVRDRRGGVLAPAGAATLAAAHGVASAAAICHIRLLVGATLTERFCEPQAPKHCLTFSTCTISSGGHLCTHQSHENYFEIFLQQYSAMSSPDCDGVHAANMVTGPEQYGCCRRMAAENERRQRYVLKTTASFMAEW